ncbi:hypothetical protein ABPG72_012480 [Tetrahymena utriculariae]
MKLSQKQIKDQIQRILDSIDQKQNIKEHIIKLSDIGKLQGFGDDNSIRLKAYQILLGISEEDINLPFTYTKNDSFEEGDYFKQILRDCSGSFKLLDVCLEQDEEQIQSLRKKLILMVSKLFKENTSYQYYRGYENFYALEVEIDKSVSIQVNNIFKIIKQEDQQVAQIFSVTHFLAFCVGWVLTWFAFNIRKNKDLLRIYDFLISSPPENVVILGVAFILGTKDILKEHIQESQEGGEIGVLYGIYQNIWQVDYDLEHIISVAMQLYKKQVFTPEMRSEYSQEQLNQFVYNLNQIKKLFQLEVQFIKMYTQDQFLQDNIYLEEIIKYQNIQQYQQY